MGLLSGANLTPQCQAWMVVIPAASPDVDMYLLLHHPHHHNPCILSCLSPSPSLSTVAARRAEPNVMWGRLVAVKEAPSTMATLWCAADPTTTRATNGTTGTILTYLAAIPLHLSMQWHQLVLPLNLKQRTTMLLQQSETNVWTKQYTTLKSEFLKYKYRLKYVLSICTSE